jgi:hypothetical protein
LRRSRTRLSPEGARRYLQIIPFGIRDVAA